MPARHARKPSILARAVARVVRVAPPSLPAAARRRERQVIEALETRRLLATINWVNEFSDNFSSYGSDEGQARNIVRRAIADWEAVIVDFNYDDNGSNQNNEFDLTVQAENIGGRGSAQVTSRDDGTDRKPDAATVRMDNSGTTWYFDPFIGVDGTPDDGEFTFIRGLFNAEAVGGTADSGNDFYRTIVHEIGHAMGILNSGGFLKIADNLVDTGVNDPFDSGADLLEVRIGGIAQYTLTSNGGGHLFEGGGGYSGPTHPFDLMNSGRTSGFGERSLISDDNVALLRDVYGYTVVLPSQVNTFHANLDRFSNTLTINGDIPGFSDNDTIDLERDGVDAQIEFGNGVFAREIIPDAEYDTIIVNAGDGNDDVDLDRIASGKTVTVNLGGGDDRVDVAPDDDDVDTFVGSDVTINGGTGTNSVFFNDTADGVGGDTWTLLSGSTDKGGRTFTLFDIDAQTIFGAEIPTVYNVDGLAIDTQINAGDDNDTFDVGGGDFDSSFTAELTLDAGLGTNSLTIDDSNDTFGDDYLVDAVGGSFPYVYTKSSEPLGSVRWNNELVLVDFLLNTGSNDFVFGAPGAFSSSQDYDVFGGDGNDNVIIGDGTGGLANMDADVSFTGEGGVDALIYDGVNTSPGTGRSFSGSTLDSGQDGTFAAITTTERFELGLFGPGETLEVTNLRGGLTLDVQGNGGNDTVNVGNGDFDTLILGEIVFSGGLGTDLLRVLDTADGGNDPYDFVSIPVSPVTPAASHRFSKEIGGGLTFLNDIETVRVDANDGNNTFNLLGGGGMPSNLELELNGNDGDDTLNYGDGSFGIAFYDQLTDFNGGVGSDTVNLNGQGLVAGTYDVSSTVATNNFIGDIQFSSTSALNVASGSGGDTMNVTSLFSSTALDFNSGSGNDTVNIGNGTVSSIDGTVDVNVFGGDDTLNYNDQSFFGGTTYTLNSLDITRPGSGVISFDNNVSTFNANLGNGSDIVNVTASTFISDYNVLAGNGVDTVNVINAGGFGINLDTGAGNDDVFVNDDDTGIARVTIPVTDRYDQFVIGDGGLVDITPGADKVLTVRSLEIRNAGSQDGQLDLNDNGLIVNYSGGFSPIEQIVGLIADGYNGGAWGGDGIDSNRARLTSGTALGYAEASQLGLSSFLGQSVDSTSLLVRYTVIGDGNLDGTVNLADFGLLRGGFGVFNSLWAEGDFNYDRNTNLTDFGLLRGAFGTSV